MIVFPPDTLIGRPVMFENGHTGNISKLFDITTGLVGLDPRWIVEITIALNKRECHFDPRIGVSLTGKRLYPITQIGRTYFVID